MLPSEWQNRSKWLRITSKKLHDVLYTIQDCKQNIADDSAATLLYKSNNITGLIFWFHGTASFPSFYFQVAMATCRAKTLYELPIAAPTVHQLHTCEYRTEHSRALETWALWK